MSDFNPVDFGAKRDENSLNTAAIQQAIDACNQSGGGRVVCPPGRWLIGTLQLKSNVELHLSPGCTLAGSTDLAAYADFSAPGFRVENAAEGNTKSLIQAVEVENASITGSGEINGSGPAFYDTTKMVGPFFSKPATARPRMVMAYNCRNLRFDGPSFIDSPCWTFWLMKCERVWIQRIRVAGDQRMINNDGIDLDSCRDVTVSDCMLKTGDDCLILRAVDAVFDTPGVCENISVSNCVLDSWCQGIRVGCPSDGVIRNCAFSNLVIHSENHGIHFENPQRYLVGNQGSADIRDIMFSNITINSKHWPIRLFIEEGVTLRRLAGISFSDIRIKSGFPCIVQGNAGSLIEDVRFSNVQVETTGGDAIVCSHCRNVKLDSVELSAIQNESA